MASSAMMIFECEFAFEMEGVDEIRDRDDIGGGRFMGPPGEFHLLGDQRAGFLVAARRIQVQGELALDLAHHAEHLGVAVPDEIRLRDLLSEQGGGLLQFVADERVVLGMPPHQDVASREASE